MKKYILVLIGLCLWTAQLDAQVAFATARELAMISRGVAKSVRKGNPLYIPGKARVGRTGLYPFQVRYVLKRRVAKTRRHALKAKKTIPENRQTFLGNPVKRLDKLAPNLGKKGQFVATYLTAQENRLYAQEVRRLQETVFPKLNALLPQLEQQASARVAPQDPIKFIAKQIPPQTKMLFVGESHGFAEIQNAVAELVSHLHYADLEKEIFFFTEFLPQDFVWESKIPDWYERPLAVSGLEYPREMLLWNRVSAMGIKVVGLEPLDICVTTDYIPAFQPNNIEFPVSLRGGKYRNEEFLKTLQQYRQEHPDALFIVYTGRGHVAYNAPYSLANNFKPEETFVLSLRPSLKRLADKFSVSVSQLGEEGIASPILFAKGKVLTQDFQYWQDKDIAKTVGYDAHIHIEELP